MAKDDLLTVSGRVHDILGGGVYGITLDSGITVHARLCGKMRKFSIKVVVGDHVDIGISPYDPTHGLITHRHKVVR